MRLIPTLLIVGLVTLAAGFAHAETSGEPKTLMTEPGKLIFSDDFTSPPGKEWKVAKGRWEIVDGALQGSEIKSEMHGAAMRHMIAFDNAVIQYSFKLDGAKGTSLSINDPKGHNCRVTIGPNGFAVRKDDHDHTGPDKALLLENHAMKIKPGVWHTITVEILGSELLARLDDGPVAFGSDPSIDTKKSNVGLTVAGESASFKQFRIWEAKPNADWSATKTRLTSERPEGKTTSK
jgi:hypothetical protein